MSAGHFFVGLGAGIAILAVPVMTLTPASNLPGQFVQWIDGPPPQSMQLTTEDTAANRPLSGYRPGDPTPASHAAPTLQPPAAPTPVPTARPIGVAPASPSGAFTTSAAPLNTLRWAGTGVIRSNGIPVYVRRVAGVDSRDDPLIPDGSPVLVAAGPPLQVGSQQWRAVRGLSGLVGWVPSTQLAVDGEAPPQPLMAAAGVGTPAATAPTPAPAPTSSTARGVITNTGGVGVVLRNSPTDADRSRVGLMDGAGVALLEYSGSSWVHVQADNGQGGWVPAQYVQPAN